MQYLNLNSTPTYSKYAAVPIMQQVIGVTGLLKNTSLLVSDIVIKLFFFGQSINDINKKFEDRLELYSIYAKKIKESIKELRKKVELFNNGSSEDKRNDLIQFNKFMEKVEKKFGLQNIKSGIYFRFFKLKKDSIVDLELRVEELISKLERIALKRSFNSVVTDNLRPLPLGKRVQNIALGFITIIPVISTIYHIFLLKLVFSKVESQQLKGVTCNT